MSCCYRPTALGLALVLGFTIQQASAHADRLRQALQRYVGDVVARSVDTRPSFICAST